jgi:hypothetical protein
VGVGRGWAIWRAWQAIQGEFGEMATPKHGEKCSICRYHCRSLHGLTTTFLFVSWALFRGAKVWTRSTSSLPVLVLTPASGTRLIA